MKAVWTIAGKDLSLLMRDARAVIVLLAMPLIVILILGVSLGEGFGKKAAEGLRVSVLNLDTGVPRFFDRPAIGREAAAWCAVAPVSPLAGAALAVASHEAWFPHTSWSDLLLHDLGDTAQIRVELIESREEAAALVRSGRRAAVLVLGPNFSKRVERCSFRASGWSDVLIKVSMLPGGDNPVSLALAASFRPEQSALPLYLLDGLNPFFRDGVKLDVLDVEVMRDPTQQTAAAIIDQVAQGSLLRVVMPWMIGRAFEKLGDPQFLGLLGREPSLPAPVKLFLTSPFVSWEQKAELSTGLQNALQNLFPRYNLTAKTWAALTRESERPGSGSVGERYATEGGGLLRRGAARYQLLVPSYLVMFAFFLVLTVGWLFVAERRQGTMLRLLAAPLTSGQILLGKLLPCLAVSLLQGFFILLAGRAIFGMSWGPDPLWLLPLVMATSLAAMGLALLVAALARTETQVAIYGTLLVLLLAGISGGLMGDRSQLPEAMQTLSLVTPHAWALNAYRQLLTTPHPDVQAVAQACLVLAGFGVGFLALAWWFLRLEV